MISVPKKKRWQGLIPLLLLLLAGGCEAALSFGSEVGRRTSPKISFAKDERVVTVKYGEQNLTIPRPVTIPWAYQPVGKVYWVATNGNDRGNGSQDRPLRTIANAIGRMQAGDIVYVRAGIYYEALNISRSGKPGKPIIISCAPEDLGNVKITPTREYVKEHSGGAVITVQGAHHVWINGLVIEGPRGRPEAPTSETYGANGITWSDAAGRGCRATNNVVYGHVHCGLKEMGHGGVGILMEGNVIFGNGTNGRDHGIYAPANDITARGNVIFDNVGYGIHSYSLPHNQKIYRNVIFRNKEGGIILAGNDNEVLHNTVAQNGRGIFYFRGGCKNNTVENNIFAFNRVDCDYDNGGGAPGYGDPMKNLDDYNCYFPGKPFGSIAPGKHEILADPRLAAPATGDFRLRSTSPCKGAAAAVEAFGKKISANFGAFD